MYEIAVLAIIYILVVIAFKNIQELTIFSCWLILILLKRSFTLSHILISFIGFSGLILCLRQSRDGQLDEIDAIITALILHLLVLSKGFVLSSVQQIYRKLKQLYEKKSVCMKLLLVNVLTATTIVFYICSVCYVIDIVLVWVNDFPLNTEINFVASHGKFHGFEQNVEIAEGELAYSQKIFFVDEHQSSLYSHQHVLHKDVNSLPLSNLLIEAYPGENAELTCSFHANLPAGKSLYSLSLFFTQASIEVVNSPRRRIRLPDEKLKNDTFYTFSLTLFDIRPDDFGIYRAGVRIIMPFGSPFSISSETIYESVYVREEYACVFNLSRIIDHYEYVDAPAGALLSFEHLYIKSKSDYLRVEHYVNGMPLSLISNISSDCCLPSVRFLLETWNQIYLNLPSVYMIYDQFQQRLEVIASVCVCSAHYGIHRFKFYNDIYDWKQRIWITLEFWHPHITIVYPKSSNLPWNSLSERETRLFDRSKNERNFSLFEGPAFELLQSNIDDDFVVMKHIELCLIVVIYEILIGATFASLLYLLKLVSKVRCYAFEKLGLLLKVKLPDTGGNLANALQIKDDCKRYNHDVFVLNVDDDRHFVIKELHPVFVERQLSVFLSEEDLPSGPKIENLKQALAESRKIIVVVSNSFINCKLYNNFFLPHIVLSRLNKCLIAFGHLMLLVSEPCSVPESLIQDDRIVTLDFTRNTRDIFQRKLNEWLTRSVIRHGFGSQPILHSDLVQLSQA